MRFLQLHSVHWLWKLWDSPHLDTAWFTGEVRQETLMTLYATTWWPHTQNDWVGVRLQAHSCLEKSSALWLALAVNTLWGDTHTHAHTRLEKTSMICGMFRCQRRQWRRWFFAEMIMSTESGRAGEASPYQADEATCWPRPPARLKSLALIPF